MKKVDYSMEFKVITDIMDVEQIEEKIPVDEESQMAFKEEWGVVPKFIKTGNIIENKVVIKKNAVYKRWIPDYRRLKIHQIFTEKGLIEQNKFAVIEPEGDKYIVKGNYSKFKTLIAEQSPTSIGYM